MGHIDRWLKARKHNLLCLDHHTFRSYITFHEIDLTNTYSGQSYRQIALHVSRLLCCFNFFCCFLGFPSIILASFLTLFIVRIWISLHPYEEQTKNVKSRIKKSGSRLLFATHYAKIYSHTKLIRVQKSTKHILTQARSRRYWFASCFFIAHACDSPKSQLVCLPAVTLLPLTLPPPLPLHYYCHHYSVTTTTMTSTINITISIDAVDSTDTITTTNTLNISFSASASLRSVQECIMYIGFSTNTAARRRPKVE